MPDIDLDFADNRRDEVLSYISQKYGQEKVAQIITFGTMASRGSVRDTGRALGLPLGEVDRVAKAIPFGLSIAESLEAVPTLKELGINVVFAVERGIVAPKGTPADILAKLEAACAQATKDPAFAESMKKQGTEVRYLDRKAYADFFKMNDALNKELARDLGLLKR